MRHRGAFLIAMLALTVGAFAFRIPALGNRPFHGDEAVHAFKFVELWKHGKYVYDRNEYHGPTLYYAALPSIWVQGRHTFAETREADYRLPIVLFGAAMVLIIAGLSDGLGRRAIFCAGILTAISPALVFYSRYYIQETLLAFFTLATIVCGWRYARHGRRRWLLLAGVSGGLMIASKETAIFAFAAMAGAFFLTPWWTRRVDGRPAPATGFWHPKYVAIAVLAGLLVACIFISGFFTNRDGPLGILTGPIDYLRAYTPWLKRAGGSSLHVYPWHYYLGILLWTRRENGPVYSEALIVLLALVGFVTAMLPPNRSQFRGSHRLARFIAFYTLILTVIYSVIPYKTPWCLISFLNGMILLAGFGVVALLDWAHNLPARSAVRIVDDSPALRRQTTWRRSLPARVIVSVLFIAGCVQLEIQSHRASYEAFTDPRNPYVYSQPVPDVENLGIRAVELARYSPQGPRTTVKVIWTDNYYWPIPWYLREFENVGFYNDASDPEAPIIFASPEFEDELTKKLDKTHLLTKTFGIRSGVFAQCWIRLDVWEHYLKNRPKPKDDD
jgi:uncharacterized protein (TIGR03663 family)